MIIPEREPKLVLVRQPEHAKMSGRIARRWQRPAWLTPGAWKRFVEAVRRHDDGWISEEARPALDPRGFPYDFLRLPPGRHLAVWKRSVRLAGRADPWGGLLVAGHARWLTGMSRGRAASAGQNAIDRFLEGLDAEIERLKRILQSGPPADRILAASPGLSSARRLFSLLDSLSLRLLGAIGLETTGPVCFGEREERLSIAGDGQRFSVDPWPFRAPAFRVAVTACEVAPGPYRDPGSLAKAMARARRRTLRWELGGSA